ncbi:MAG: hypothetical protein HOV87_12215 [Catenulispora sp.]|nr:hypothetical protein [Catenulispora sp.]NUT39988.1 hypothetical protein [Thermoactinospora sp.]
MTSMDIAEIYRSAAERGEPVETYGPDALVAEVAELLRAKGLHPDAAGRMGAATGGAGMMLRAFGIVPADDHTVIDRHNAPDPDER